MFKINQDIRYCKKNIEIYKNIYKLDNLLPYKKWGKLPINNKKIIPKRIINRIESWSQKRQDFYVLSLLNYKKMDFL